MNSLGEKYDVKLSLFHPYIRGKEKMYKVVDYFTRIDQSNIFVGFTICHIFLSLMF